MKIKLRRKSVSGFLDRIYRFAQHMHDLSVYPHSLDFLQYVCGGASAWIALVPAGDIAICLGAGV